MLQSAVSILGGIKTGGRGSQRDLAALDHGVLRVAVMVAALDGEILPGEYVAFEPLLKSCRGGRGAKAAATFDALLASAGRILVMAQSGRFSEDERLKAFVDLAHEALPNGFRDGSVADLRRAFALWQVMAMSDGSVSDLEQSALKLLLVEFAGVTNEAAKPTFLLEGDFLKKVALAVGGLTEPETRKQSQEVLFELVTTIALQDGSKVRRHQANRVMVSTLMGIAVAMAALGGG